MLKVGPADAGETRQLVLTTLKRYGPVTIAAIAHRLGLTHEAVRQHLVQLVQQDWVEPCKPRRALKKKGGRPATRYCLSVAGDHLFPKHYDVLTLDVLKAISASFGDQAVLDILAAMADETVTKWKPLLTGKSLAQKIAFLRDRYAELDRAVRSARSGDDYLMVEGNCPFLNVALERPALCSVTVNVLTRLLQRKVFRSERFQNGDGRCVFRILGRQPTQLNRFALEPTHP